MGFKYPPPNPGVGDLPSLGWKTVSQADEDAGAGQRETGREGTAFKGGGEIRSYLKIDSLVPPLT